MVYIRNNLTTFKNIKTLFKYDVTFLVMSSYTSIFCKKRYFLLLNCKPSFAFGFLGVSIFFLLEHLCFDIYYGNIFINFGIEGAKNTKIKKMFFLLSHFQQISKKTNPLMQLRLVFHKAINKNKLNVWKFRNHRLSSFSAINKTVTGVEGK